MKRSIPANLPPGDGLRGTPRRVLGLDPSLRATGYGVLERVGEKFCVLSYGVLRTERKQGVGSVLAALEHRLEGIVRDYAPEAAAMERVIFVQSMRTALDLGAVRGVLLLTLARHSVPVHEYAPRLLKLGVTGRGGATKSQVAFMVRSVLGLRNPPPADVADALAAALVYLHRRPWSVSLCRKE